MYVVVSYLANGKQSVSQPLSYEEAYALWERKSSRTKQRVVIRRAVGA
jgi:hypothetical protein